MSTTLIKCEIDLAKMELKKDAIKLGMGGALVGMAAFAGCLILLFGGFAFAYGLSAAAAIPLYAAFGLRRRNLPVPGAGGGPDRIHKIPQDQWPAPDPANRPGGPDLAQARGWGGGARRKNGMNAG